MSLWEWLLKAPDPKDPKVPKDPGRDSVGRPRSTTPRRRPDTPMTPDERRAKDRERKRERYRRQTKPDPKKDKPTGGYVW